MIAGGAGAGCPANLRQRLDSVSLFGDADFASLNADLGPGCRAIRIELPAGARFTGFRYEASGGAVTADCLPGRDCPAGGARFPFEPVIRREGGRTILLVAFESTAAEPRAGVVAGYFSFTRK